MNLTVNGKPVTTDAPGEMRLLDFIREELHLTGTKEGCGEGECGACTVLLDGKPVDSCLVLLFQCENREILTIEGLSDGDTLHPVQQAFIEVGAVQCGYCIPGMVLSSKAILDRNPDPDAAAIKEGLSGNLCRCTGYLKMEQAVRLAARRLRGDEDEA
ncbi:MAG: (2Fe-2S)-binding protein [Clostridiaceae bacterium]